jgi:hypothetical protein
VSQHDVAFATGTPLAFGVGVGEAKPEMTISVIIRREKFKNIGEDRDTLNPIRSQNLTDVKVKAITDDVKFDSFILAEQNEVLERRINLMTPDKPDGFISVQPSDGSNSPAKALLRRDPFVLVLTQHLIVPPTPDILPEKCIAHILLRDRAIKINKHL